MTAIIIIIIIIIVIITVIVVVTQSIFLEIDELPAWLISAGEKLIFVKLWKQYRMQSPTPYFFFSGDMYLYVIYLLSISYCNDHYTGLPMYQLVETWYSRQLDWYCTSSTTLNTKLRQTTTLQACRSLLWCINQQLLMFHLSSTSLQSFFEHTYVLDCKPANSV